MFIGSYNLASQKGMSIGGVRHAADVKVDALSKESGQRIPIQSGSFTILSYRFNLL